MSDGKNHMTEEKLNDLRRQLSGVKSISEMSGVNRSEGMPRKQKPLADSVSSNLDNDTDKQQAEIELSYLNAAITLAQGSNYIGAEVVIGPFTIGISKNSRLVEVLRQEANEINKYLKGLPNDYE